MIDKKSPAEALYEELNLEGRMKHVDEFIAFIKTKQGNYIAMQSSNATQSTLDKAVKMLVDMNE